MTITTVAGTYDPYLVALSYAVACFASYTALDLAGRVRASTGWARGGWLTTAAISMGGGIWSMHFIAMLAFLMPMPVSFDFGLTVLSLLVAIAVTGVGFYVIGTRQATALQLAFRTVAVWQRIWAAAVMGFAISGMHYTGMAAAVFTAHSDLHAVDGATGLAQTNLA